MRTIPGNFCQLDNAHLTHPFLDGDAGVSGQADQLTVKSLEVVDGRGEVCQLGGGEGVEGGGKDDDGCVGGAPGQHQRLLLSVPMDQDRSLRGALVIGGQVLGKDGCSVPLNIGVNPKPSAAWTL